MAFNREIWRTRFTSENIPNFPCPHCKNGQLAFKKDSLVEVETSFSKNSRKDADWEPDWIKKRFNYSYECISQQCGEHVNCIGETELVEIFDEEIFDIIEVLSIKAIFPSPPIITYPKNTPFKVSRILTESFPLFWTDRGAASSKIRSCLEEILNHYDIPKTILTKKGKERRLDLAERITIFEQSKPDYLHHFSALRQMGNVGTHGRQITESGVLDAYEITDNLLEELFEDKEAKKQNIKKITENILQNKGNI